MQPTNQVSCEKSVTSACFSVTCCQYVTLYINVRGFVEFYYTCPTNAQYINTMWTGDADLRLYITTVQDG